MNVFSEYSQPTIDFIWQLLEDAYEDEDELDKILDEKDQMTHKLVFVFDKTVEIDKIKNLISDLSDHEIYIVSTNDKISEISEENVKILDFSKEIIENPNYLMADGIHLTKEGNDNLNLKIKEFLNQPIKNGLFYVSVL